MNLNELKASLDKSMNIDSVLERIKECAHRGDNEVHFAINNDHEPKDGSLNERQAEILRNMGYSVYRDGICLWYEVKGW